MIRQKRFVLTGLCLLSCLSSYAQQTTAPLIELAQRFHPIVNRCGMVASQEAEASKIGRDILAKGGNAVDAAVAVGFALAVTLPRAGGLGGGGFMLIWLNDKKKALAINYRETAPELASVDMFLNKKGDVDNNKARFSHQATGVPGNVAGLILAQERFGTLPLATVMQPAIDLAERGIIVSSDLARSLTIAKDLLGKSTASRKIFFKDNNKPYAQDELLIQKDLAKSLKDIAKHGAKAFYQGEIAEKIAEDMQQHGGLISRKDLANYQAEIVEPVKGNYRGYTIYAMPPPSSGGITLIEMLNILEGFPVSEIGLNNAEALHLLTEIMNLAYRDRNDLLADPKFANIPIKKLLSKQYAIELRKKINLQQHTPAAKLTNPIRFVESFDTTHFSVIDKNKNMVANTFTLNYSYGNGCTVAGTGIILNNEMDDFTAKPGVANSFGLIQSEKNSIAPHKQPLSSMTPTIIIDPQGQPFLATGTPGGSRIITTLLQVIINIIDHKLNIAAAANIPRIHSQLWPDKMLYEQGISNDSLVLLKKRGHTYDEAAAMGSVQSVANGGKFVYGASDPRRPGSLAVGY